MLAAGREGEERKRQWREGEEGRGTGWEIGNGNAGQGRNGRSHNIHCESKPFSFEHNFHKNTVRF